MKCDHPCCKRNVIVRYEFRSFIFCSFWCWFGYSRWYGKTLYGGQEVWPREQKRLT